MCARVCASTRVGVHIHMCALAYGDQRTALHVVSLTSFMSTPSEIFFLFRYYCYICIHIYVSMYSHPGIVLDIRKLVPREKFLHFSVAIDSLQLFIYVWDLVNSPLSMLACQLVYRQPYCWDFMDVAGVFILWPYNQSFFPFFHKFPWHLGMKLHCRSVNWGWGLHCRNVNWGWIPHSHLFAAFCPVMGLCSSLSFRKNLLWWGWELHIFVAEYLEHS